eukprot:CAMPEP_0119308024 /NCGR_PEP_ID=MMETSP1333-20130426/8358_1 /TAXON_ID=418940 /ORGANISM="Scyphosphaera apsteinii, Strain RCC1455" /LENGTH=66 /DNA_ID=CAMNT_0007311705 /DNA_START=17 /DNA_END=217 /DNA_ORIENTATION=-
MARSVAERDAALSGRDHAEPTHARASCTAASTSAAVTSGISAKTAPSRGETTGIAVDNKRDTERSE